MEFRTLGELEVWHADSPVPIKGAVQRSVLALLLMRANDVVRLRGKRAPMRNDRWAAFRGRFAAHQVDQASRTTNCRQSCVNRRCRGHALPGDCGAPRPCSRR